MSVLELFPWFQSLVRAIAPVVGLATVPALVRQLGSEFFPLVGGWEIE